MSDERFCDHCGCKLAKRWVHVGTLPIDVSSANAGESATLCKPCHNAMLHADALMEDAHAAMERAAQRGLQPDELDADGRPGLGFGPGNKKGGSK